MMRLAPILAALLLGGCATTSAPPAALDRVEYDTKSWGRVVSGWVIGPQGGGTWYERVNESGQPGPVGPYRVEYHDLEVGEEGFTRLAALLGDLPDPAPGYAECREFRTDDYYGALRLTSGATTQEVSYNQGCMDADYQQFMRRLLAADALVASWGKAAPVTRVLRYAADGAQPTETIN